PVAVYREPAGVVAAIIPWNGPQVIVSGKLAPALIAGCTVVVKPAPQTPLDGYLLAEMVQEAGIPPGVVSIVAAGREAGEHLVGHPGVDVVAFTGSTAAGRRVGAICGDRLKRCTLELGGKSAAIILDDADLAGAMDRLKPASLINSGQTCVAQTRILASRFRYDEVIGALAGMVKDMKLGDPADTATEIGPPDDAKEIRIPDAMFALFKGSYAAVTERQARRVPGLEADIQAEPAGPALGNWSSIADLARCHIDRAACRDRQGATLLVV